MNAKQLAVKKFNAWIDKFAEQFKNNPTMLMIISFLAGSAPFPFAGIIAAQMELLSWSVAKLHKDRFTTLITELERGERSLTEEIIQSEEFIHSLLVVYRAAMRTYQRDKIRLFARILISATERDLLASDTFEEFVQILEELSVRELEILKLLKNFEDTHPTQEAENILQRTQRFWAEFEKNVEGEFEVPFERLPGMLTRLTRTGLYEPISGSYLNYRGGKGTTTELFSEFSVWILTEADK